MRRHLDPEDDLVSLLLLLLVDQLAGDLQAPGRCKILPIAHIQEQSHGKT